MITTAIRNHTELLNYLVEKYNLKNYLEIGVQNPANNYDKIKSNTKCGVDPEPINTAGRMISKKTSDEFFKDNREVIGEKWDLVFIDGLHHADQVKRDFENSLKCLNEGGFIVLHDTLPEDESTTHVPRDSKMWHGDVYKFAMTLDKYNDIKFFTVNIDCGCTVVFKGSKKSRPVNEDFTIDWNTYKVYGEMLLNIIEPDEIEKYF